MMSLSWRCSTRLTFFGFTAQDVHASCHSRATVKISSWKQVSPNSHKALSSSPALPLSPELPSISAFPPYSLSLNRLSQRPSPLPHPNLLYPLLRSYSILNPPLPYTPPQLQTYLLCLPRSDTYFIHPPRLHTYLLRPPRPHPHLLHLPHLPILHPQALQAEQTTALIKQALVSVLVFL